MYLWSYEDCRHYPGLNLSGSPGEWIEMLSHLKTYGKVSIALSKPTRDVFEKTGSKAKAKAFTKWVIMLKPDGDSTGFSFDKGVVCLDIEEQSFAEFERVFNAYASGESDFCWQGAQLNLWFWY